MTRPLAREGVGELEALFEKRKSDLPALKNLIDELAYRNTPRATALLDKAQRVLKFVENHRNKVASNTAAPVDARDLIGTPTPIQDGFEFEVPVFRPAEIPRREPTPAAHVVTQPVPVVLPVLAVPLAKKPGPAPIEMSVEQAYRILKVTSAASWDAIELSRRQLVARAQPDRVAGLEPAKRKALQDEAQVANIAYKTLLNTR